MVKVVTFDLDGVYFTEDSFRNFKNNLPKTATDSNLIDFVFFKSPEQLNFRLGRINEDQFWDYVKTTLGVNLPNNQIFSLLADSYKVDVLVDSVVTKVGQLGLKTAICSNNNPTRIRVLNNKFSFLSKFDIQIFSYEIGAVKPEPAIYKALIESSGCLASEIVYSDDKPQNVQSALDLGINAFLYSGFDDFKSRLRTLGVAI